MPRRGERGERRARLGGEHEGGDVAGGGRLHKYRIVSTGPGAQHVTFTIPTGRLTMSETRDGRRTSGNSLTWAMPPVVGNALLAVVTETPEA